MFYAIIKHIEVKDGGYKMGTQAQPMVGNGRVVFDNYVIATMIFEANKWIVDPKLRKSQVEASPGLATLVGQFDDALDRCYLESWIGFERSLNSILQKTHVTAIYQEVDLFSMFA